MCVNAAMQLGFLSLGQSDGSGCLRNNAIPYVLDELDALGDRQFHIFGGDSVSTHVRSINQG